MDDHVKLPAGSRIICSNGHDCGAVGAKIFDDEAIVAGALAFKNTLPTPDPAHICKTCGETVAKFIDGRWQIHTDTGWVD